MKSPVTATETPKTVMVTTPYSGASYGTAYKNCKHPRFVRVGEKAVYIISYRDFDNTSLQRSELEALDVFIGLSSSWDKYELTKKVYANPLLNKIAEAFPAAGIKSVIMLEVPDYNVDHSVYQMVLSLMRTDLRIGFGCYGAHGRTGWLLAKLIKAYEGVDGDEAVRRVRHRLCPECVESESQCQDLGCITELPYKTYTPPVSSGQGFFGYGSGYQNYGPIYAPESKVTSLPSTTRKTEEGRKVKLFQNPSDDWLDKDGFMKNAMRHSGISPDGVKYEHE